MYAQGCRRTYYLPAQNKCAISSLVVQILLISRNPHQTGRHTFSQLLSASLCAFLFARLANGPSPQNSRAAPNTALVLDDEHFSAYWADTVPECAFVRRTDIVKVIVPDRIKSIGEHAFYGCTKLREVTLPCSVTAIGKGAFRDCSALAEIVLPPSVVTIGEHAFLAGPTPRVSAVSAEFPPEWANAVPDNAFEDRKDVVSATVPDRITSIGAGAFLGCSWLVEVTLPASITSIGAGAFLGCVRLLKVTLPPSVVSIGDCAFQQCLRLTEIVLPPSVGALGKRVFCGCSKLTTVVVPDSVTEIGDSAFYGCSELVGVTVPASVTSTGTEVFKFCPKLQATTTLSDASFPKEWNGAVPANAFEGRTDVCKVVVPPTIVSIGIGAFRGCSGLVELSLPLSLTSIAAAAFEGCSALLELVLPPSVRTIGCGMEAGAGAGDSAGATGDQHAAVERVGAVQSCISLRALVLPRALQSLSPNTFVGSVLELRLLSVPLSSPADVVAIVVAALDKQCFNVQSVSAPDAVVACLSGPFSGMSTMAGVPPKRTLSLLEQHFWATKTHSLGVCTLAQRQSAQAVLLIAARLKANSVPGAVPAPAAAAATAPQDASGATAVTRSNHLPVIHTDVWIMVLGFLRRTDLGGRESTQTTIPQLQWAPL
jgi:hypothetical protein